ncbi:hypothetical protein [Amycolatopsis antarctica]|uniref:hypothetical protein n=1 Tax=Amycolatopsis antarctica TaxID=1854586 RepID=UPI00196AA28E|nr:hypothetical protein [Amycolatopsis antarctica]
MRRSLNGTEKGKVCSPEFAGEHSAGRTVVALWQQYWHDDRFGKRDNVWAAEVHHFRGWWYIIACTGNHSRKVGSFMLVSEGGVAGPYRLVAGNRNKPFGDCVIGGPDFVEPGSYHHIDGGFYPESDRAWLVLHNDFYAGTRRCPGSGSPRTRRSPTWRARTSSATKASTTWSALRGTELSAVPTAAPGMTAFRRRKDSSQ